MTTDLALPQVAQLDENTPALTITPELIKPYIAVMRIGGKDIVDINNDGVNRLAAAANVGIGDVEVSKETDDYYEIKSTAVNAAGREYTTLYRQNKRFDNGTENANAFATAVTKANRNAQKGHLPMRAIRELAERIYKGEAVPQGNPPPAAPPSQSRPNGNGANGNGNGSPSNAISKHVFALVKEHEETILMYAGTQDTFWDKVRERYGVKSRTEMTLELWNDLLNGIRPILKAQKDEADKSLELAEFIGTPYA